MVTDQHTVPRGAETLAIIGVGVIGLAWARLAREHAWDVRVFDVRPDVADVVNSVFGDDTGVMVADSLEDCIRGATFVQENGPERLDIKRDTIGSLVAAADPSVVIATSSSSITAGTIIADGIVGSSVLVGHPFNPPDLMPLVEVVPSAATSESAVTRAVSVYRSLGRTPVVINKEIAGFVANRLQGVISREARYLVQQDVVSPEDLDTILQNSLGLRWATIGLFEGNVLGGGPGGIRHLISGVGVTTGGIEYHAPATDPASMEKLVEQVEATYGVGEDAYETLRARRDSRTRAVLAALAACDDQTASTPEGQQR